MTRSFATTARVLIVDDDLADLQLIAHTLQKFERPHCTLLQARNVREATECLRVSKPDLILLDLDLGDSQGPQTVSAVRRMTLRTPIIVLTGTEDEEVGLACLRGGAHDFLHKSRLASDLRRTIRFAFRRYRSVEGHAREMLERFARPSAPDVEDTPPSPKVEQVLTSLADAVREVDIGPEHIDAVRRKLQAISALVSEQGLPPGVILRALLDSPRYGEGTGLTALTLYAELAASLAEAYHQRFREASKGS